jgi:hypothetical protein
MSAASRSPSVPSSIAKWTKRCRSAKPCGTVKSRSSTGIFGAEPILAIGPADLHTWVQSLKLAPVTTAHIRSLLHTLFDLATLWKYPSPERRNPVDIVKIRNVTRRVKETFQSRAGFGLAIR